MRNCRWFETKFLSCFFNKFVCIMSECGMCVLFSKLINMISGEYYFGVQGGI